MTLKCHSTSSEVLHTNHFLQAGAIKRKRSSCAMNRVHTISTATTTEATTMMMHSTRGTSVSENFSNAGTVAARRTASDDDGDRDDAVTAAPKLGSRAALLVSSISYSCRNLSMPQQQPSTSSSSSPASLLARGGSGRKILKEVKRVASEKALLPSRKDSKNKTNGQIKQVDPMQYLLDAIVKEEKEQKRAEEAVRSNKQLLRARVERGNSVGVVLTLNVVRKNEAHFEHCAGVLCDLKELLRDMDATDFVPSGDCEREVRDILNRPRPKPAVASLRVGDGDGEDALREARRIAAEVSSSSCAL